MNKLHELHSSTQVYLAVFSYATQLATMREKKLSLNDQIHVSHVGVVFSSIDIFFFQFLLFGKTPFGFLYSIGIDAIFKDNVSSDTFESMFNAQQKTEQF